MLEVRYPLGIMSLTLVATLECLFEPLELLLVHMENVARLSSHGQVELPASLIAP